MRESTRRIRLYRIMLGHLKEKVSAMAMALVIASILMVTASMAWVTLSSKPEVKGMTTTIGANGNLEVALSDLDGKEPDESKVGDGAKDLVERNLTWGNIINLSDPSYGLENIVLRPASLNLGRLETNPLYAARYSSDGRIDGWLTDFAYTNYNKDVGGFLVSDEMKYGVRAISSVKVTYAGQTAAFVERKDAVTDALRTAQESYANLVSTSNPYMQFVCDLLGEFLSTKITDDTSVNYGKYTETMLDMMNSFRDTLRAEAEVYLRLVNLKLYIENPSRGDYYTDIDEMLASTDTRLSGMTSYAGFKSDYDNLEKYITQMESFCEKHANGESVLWADIAGMVNFMADIDSTLVDDLAVKDINTSNLSAVLGMITNSAPKNTIIQKGALRRIEDRVGEYMEAKNLKVKVGGVPLLGTVTMSAHVSTQAKIDVPEQIVAELDDVVNNSTGGGLRTAAETYGMAVDFWIRSNMDDDYLILEGNVLKQTVQIQDEAGRLCYMDRDTGEYVWKEGDKLYYEDGREYTPDENRPPVPAMETIIVGYDGENRVWDDLVIEDSATQGNGSCYVFYADPQEREQSLEMLKAMRIAFISEEGKLLAEAYFDTEHYYASSGRVTVPIAIDSTLQAGVDEDGNPIYAIAELKDKKAMRITALVYADGTQLTNSDVLATAEIQGQLNIQFGSYSDLYPMEDEKVSNETVRVTAQASKTVFTKEEFMANASVSSTITVSVEGLTPERVEASFVRKINETQGSLQNRIGFESAGAGSWSIDATFTAPGTYVLRSVFLDGVEYFLNGEVQIEIDGFLVESLGWEHATSYARVLTADAAHSENIWVNFAGNEMTPKSVKAIFANTDNQQITVSMKSSNGRWIGTAKFVTSGTYTIQYLLVDDEYYEIPTNSVKILNLSLGIRANIELSQTNIDYTGPTNISVTAAITDNKGNMLPGLEDVRLQYLQQGSSLETNGLDTALVWDGVNYVGNFPLSKAGAFSFAYIVMGDSVIRSAEAPTLLAIPPDAPQYYTNLTDANTFAAGQNAYMRLAVKFSSAISDGSGMSTALDELSTFMETNGMVALMEKDGKQILVAGHKEAHSFTEDESLSLDVSDWMFKIPTDSDLTDLGIVQEGTWKITKLYIVGAYDENGTYHSSENPIELDLQSRGIETVVSNEMQVVLEGDGASSTGAIFMSEESFMSGLRVKVQSTTGIPASGVTNVVINYKLDTNALAAGTEGSKAGYLQSTIAHLQTNSNSTIGTATLVEVEEGVFELNTEHTLDVKYEGTYVYQSLSFEIGGKKFTTATPGAGETQLAASDVITTNAPSFTLSWKSPEVVITGVEPLGNITVNTVNTDDAAKSSTVANVFTDYTATANLSATIANFSFSSGCSTSTEARASAYSKPTVTAKILDGGDYTNAKLPIKPQSSSEETVMFTYANGALKASDFGGDLTKYTSKDEDNKTYIYKRGVLGNGTAEYLTIYFGDNQEIAYVFQLAQKLTITQNY